MKDVIEKICGQLPDGFEIQLYMEKGAACVTLTDGDGRYRNLPDTTDKTLADQLAEALFVAEALA